MNWHVYSLFFATFFFLVVIDTWTPWGPAPYYPSSKVILRALIATIGICWILCSLGLNLSF